MAYLVLALGAVLSIGGALSILYGYNIVEVERGWTAVIAGATALTGGIVTIAISLVLKALLDLRHTLQGAGAMAAPLAPIELPQSLELSPSIASEPHAPEPVPLLHSEPQPTLMTPELESGMLAAILSSHDDFADVGPVENTPAHAIPIADLHHAHDAIPSHALHEEPTDSVFDQLGFLDSEAVAEVAATPEPKIEPVRPRFKVNVKPPTPVAPEPVAEPEPPAMDDWLDRAFSALDNEITPIPLRETKTVEPQPIESKVVEAPHEPEPAPPIAPPDHEMAFAEEAPHVEEAAAQAQPEPDYHPEPAPTSAVISRYEADGTSYVMYADGSIEAQSELGVYRFNSMTELKAFIEGTE